MLVYFLLTCFTCRVEGGGDEIELHAKVDALVHYLRRVHLLSYYRSAASKACQQIELLVKADALVHYLRRVHLLSYYRHADVC